MTDAQTDERACVCARAGVRAGLHACVALIRLLGFSLFALAVVYWLTRRSSRSGRRPTPGRVGSEVVSAQTPTVALKPGFHRMPVQHKVSIISNDSLFDSTELSSIDAAANSAAAAASVPRALRILPSGLARSTCLPLGPGMPHCQCQRSCMLKHARPSMYAWRWTCNTGWPELQVVARGVSTSLCLFRPQRDMCKTVVSCITVLQDESVLPESQVLHCVAGLASVLELARTCDLYVITQCSSDATQDAVHRALCDNGVVDAGLNPHVRAIPICARCLVFEACVHFITTLRVQKILFCETATGRGAMARQLEPALHIDSCGTTLHALAPFVPAMAAVRTPHNVEALDRLAVASHVTAIDDLSQYFMLPSHAFAAHSFS